VRTIGQVRYQKERGTGQSRQHEAALPDPVFPADLLISRQKQEGAYGIQDGIQMGHDAIWKHDWLGDKKPQDPISVNLRLSAVSKGRASTNRWPGRHESRGSKRDHTKNQAYGQADGE
jgi:hypothetical protein